MDVVWHDILGIGKGLLHIKGILVTIEVSMFGTQVKVNVHGDQVRKLVLNFTLEAPAKDSVTRSLWFCGNSLAGASVVVVG
eukprot:Skav202471  [mRNA]  locus=scaffold149:573414:574165:- [translate_table: standard]